jgi:NhaP-type Na+/H+ or K+/H+ antiporter
MDNFFNVLWFLFVWAVYAFLAHKVAKRGERTGLYYNRVLIISLVALLPAFIWVYVFRKPRQGIYHERYSLD